MHPDSVAKPCDWAVIGASGFVGQSIIAELREAGRSVREVHAPRLLSRPDDLEQTLSEFPASAAVAHLTQELRGARVVVNAAGLATPGAEKSEELFGANALLPGVAVLAATAAGVGRILHVSSAAVQDRMNPLDESPNVAPATPYAISKAAGEELLHRLGRSLSDEPALPSIVIFRATSVHGPGREATVRLAKLARSPWSSVAGRGPHPVPVVTPQELAAAIRFVGESSGEVPSIVLQPWEGRTTAGVLRQLGDREPHHLPTWACKLALEFGYLGSRLAGGRARHLFRKLEVLWLGQAQRVGWIDANRPAKLQVSEQAGAA